MKNLYDKEEQINRLMSEVKEADAIVIGAGAGLSTSAGFTHREITACSRASIRRHENLHVLYLELGMGANTPAIIKYPFWQMTMTNEKAVYACLNYGEAFCPEEIEDRSICIDGDIGDIFKIFLERKREQ